MVGLASDPVAPRAPIQRGRKGADRADDFDLTVTCAYYGMPPHARRVETLAPLTAITDRRLQAAARWHDRFGGVPRPHVALLVGGTSALHTLDAATARRMAREVGRFTAAAAGRLDFVTSPRTGAAAAGALRRGLARSCTRLLAHGLVRAPRDLGAMHQHLIERGGAHDFGAPLDLTPRPPLCELEHVAARARALFAAPGGKC